MRSMRPECGPPRATTPARTIAALVVLLVLATAVAGDPPRSVEEGWACLLELGLPEALGIESMACGTAYGGTIVDCGVDDVVPRDAVARLEEHLDALGVPHEDRVRKQGEPIWYEVHWPAPNGHLEARFESLDEGTSVFMSVEFTFADGVIDRCEGWSGMEVVDALRFAEGSGGGWGYDNLRDCFDLASADESGRTPLVAAIEQGYWQAPQFLARDGYGLDGRDVEGRTPLMLAIEKRHILLVQDLIEAGADLNARDDDGWTPLAYAAAHHDTDVVEALTRAGATIDTRSIDGWSPLMMAVQRAGADGVVVELLGAGASVDLRIDGGFTVLMIAAANDAGAGVLRALVDAGAGIEDRSVEGMTPLMLAAQLAMDPETVVALMDAGADIGTRDDDAWTATLHAARHNVRPEVLAALLDRGGSLLESSTYTTATEALAVNRELLAQPGLTTILLDRLHRDTGRAEATPSVTVEIDPGRAPYIEPEPPIERFEVYRTTVAGDIAYTAVVQDGSEVETIDGTAQLTGTLRTTTFQVWTDDASYLVTYEATEEMALTGIDRREGVEDVIELADGADSDAVTVVRLGVDGTVEEVILSGSTEDELDPWVLVGADPAESIPGFDGAATEESLGAGGRVETVVRFDEPGLVVELQSVSEIDHVDGRGFRASDTMVLSGEMRDVDEWGGAFSFGVSVRGSQVVDRDGTWQWDGHVEGVFGAAFEAFGESTVVDMTVDGAVRATSFVVASGAAGDPMLLDDVERANAVLLEAWP